MIAIYHLLVKLCGYITINILQHLVIRNSRTSRPLLEKFQCIKVLTKEWTIDDFRLLAVFLSLCSTKLLFIYFVVRLLILITIIDS